MRPGDLLQLTWGALRAHRVRTRLTYAAISIGIGSVLVLTALGEGARVWLVGRFEVLGSNTLIVLPGRTETRGGPPLATTTTRDITLDDMQAIQRRMPVAQVVPIAIGEAPVTYNGRGRTATLIGSTRGFLDVRQVPVERGTDLPEFDLRRGTRVCIIGRTLRRELFGEANPLGARIRVGEARYRVIGILAEKGQRLFVDLDEVVLIPVPNALRTFNRTGLFRMIVKIPSSADLERTGRRVTAILRDRHDGEEDFTILTPGALAAALGRIVRSVAAALAGIAAISLAVAGIGVMNVMVVSVTERAAEIGLAKAVGASNAQILLLFLTEAVLMSLAGAAIGIAGGLLLARAGHALYPSIPFRVPGWALALSVGVAGFIGVAFGVLPAMRAARVDPLESLRKKV